MRGASSSLDLGSDVVAAFCRRKIAANPQLGQDIRESRLSDQTCMGPGGKTQLGHGVPEGSVGQRNLGTRGKLAM